MNPVAILFGFALLACSVFYIANPFRSNNDQKKPVGYTNQQKGVANITPEKRRQVILLAIRDLDFDFQANKVADEDYQPLRAELLSQAAQLLQNQELQKDDAIEALIQSRRKAKTGMRTTEASQPQKEKAERRCQKCQAHLHENAKFCSKCGTPVLEAACPKCSQTIHPEDLFCPACGSSIDLKIHSIMVKGEQL